MVAEIPGERGPTVTDVPVGKCIHWNEDKPECAPCVDTKFTGSVDDIFHAYFGDNPDNDVWDIFMHSDKSMQHYIDEYRRTEWNVDSKSPCCAHRLMTFIAPPQDLPLVGNIRVPVRQHHRIHRPSSDVLIYRTRAEASNAPYSEVFVCDTRWIFTKVSDNEFQLQVFAEILFVQSCWVKSMIRSNAVPATVDGAQKVAMVLKRCNTIVGERSQTTKKVEQKQLRRKTTLAEMIKEKQVEEVSNSAIIPEGAPASVPGAQVTRAVSWAQLPPAAKMSAAATCVLGLLEILLFLRIVFIENANTRIQREITLLGPVLYQSVQTSETAKTLWEGLPATAMSRQLADIVENLEISKMLLKEYESKVATLSVLMNDFTTTNASSWVLYLCVGVLLSAPVLFTQSGMEMNIRGMNARLGGLKI
eukprot:CFRG4103T1